MAALDLTHQHAQVANHVLEHVSLQPALHLLIHRMPRRQVVGHHAPLHTGAHDVALGGHDVALGGHDVALGGHDVAQAIEHLAQGVLLLWGVFRHQCHVGRYERPFVVAYVTQIGFSRHAPSIPYSGMEVHNRL
jgi:hypothetical protein